MFNTSIFYKTSNSLIISQFLELHTAPSDSANQMQITALIAFEEKRIWFYFNISDR